MTEQSIKVKCKQKIGSTMKVKTQLNQLKIIYKSIGYRCFTHLS